MQTVQAIRPDREVMSRQRLPYFIGLSGQTVGALGLSMHIVVIPPGAKAEPHRHIGYETGIFVLEGRVVDTLGRTWKTKWSARRAIVARPGIAHQAVNLSATEALPRARLLPATIPRNRTRCGTLRPGGCRIRLVRRWIAARREAFNSAANVRIASRGKGSRERPCRACRGR